MLPRHTFNDPFTGQLVERLTQNIFDAQLPYFTTHALTSDDKTLIYIGRQPADDRVAPPRNYCALYAMDIKTFDHWIVTKPIRGGFLRSYVYFDGEPYAGLGLTSIAHNSPTGDVYYVEGREIHCVNAITLQKRFLAMLPPDHVIGYTHVSEDNTRLCIPTIHESAFEDINAIDATVQRLGLSSHIRVYDTQTGKQISDTPIERGWVTHVQFRPGNNNQILFNHEWCSADHGIRRMWLLDGQKIIRLRDEGIAADGRIRRRSDYVVHEMWSRDGKHIIYHGDLIDPATKTRRPFIGLIDFESGKSAEFPISPAYKRYGHYTVSNTAAKLVCDGYAEFDPPPQNTLWGGEWISTVAIDESTGEVDWRPLCRHGSSWTSQDSHPHPIFTHAGDAILFTSDREGLRQIYRVQIKNER